LNARKDTTVEVEVWDTGRPENYVPHRLVVRDAQAVGKGDGQWVRFHLPWAPDKPQNAFIIVKENPDVSLYLSREPMTGVLSFVREKSLNVARGMESLSLEMAVVRWNMRRVVRKPFCFRLLDETHAYAPERVIDGYARPYGGPHMWLSEPMKGEEWIALSWDHEVTFREVHVTF